MYRPGHPFTLVGGLRHDEGTDEESELFYDMAKTFGFSQADAEDVIDDAEALLEEMDEE